MSLLAGAGALGSPIPIYWTTTVGGTVDPITGATVGGAKTRNTATVYGILHYVEFHKNQVRQFAEIQEGDVIVDFPASVSLDGKEGLRFKIEGILYEQAKVSPELSASWDAVIGGVRLSRTVLLTRCR